MSPPKTGTSPLQSQGRGGYLSSLVRNAETAVRQTLIAFATVLGAFIPDLNAESPFLRCRWAVGRRQRIIRWCLLILIHFPLLCRFAGLTHAASLYCCVLM